MNLTGNGYFQKGHDLSRGPRKRSLRRSLHQKLDDTYLDEYVAKTRESSRSGDMAEAIKLAEPTLPCDEDEGVMESLFSGYPPEFWNEFKMLQLKYKNQRKQEEDPL
jgi:hypothetical protein